MDDREIFMGQQLQYSTRLPDLPFPAIQNMSDLLLHSASLTGYPASALI
jgi:hypothetical protein